MDLAFQRWLWKQIGLRQGLGSVDLIDTGERENRVS